MNITCILVLSVMFVCFVNARKLPVTCRTRTGARLQHGQKWNDPDHCSIYTCTIVDGEAELLGLTCSTFHVPRGCRIVDGSGKLYPECCPTVICRT
uniref:Toxin protein n=1 Tax=Hemiscorpius lepturus TaxID=520031 RepID=A0A1L4BJ53_HEMLE|nr:toxin protein [Hemiscorpius lepturus]